MPIIIYVRVQTAGTTDIFMCVRTNLFRETCGRKPILHRRFPIVSYRDDITRVRTGVEAVNNF